MLDVRIRTVSHNAHRYETVGDWWVTPLGVTEIRVSQMSNWKFEVLVGFHEWIEQTLCLDRSIREEDVTKFDVLFESERKPEDKSEPGDDPRAPYFLEHQFATNLERQFAEELGVNWDEYERYLEGLGVSNGK